MAKRKDLKSVALGDTRTGLADAGALFPTVVVLVEIQFNLVAAATEQQMTG